MGLIVTQGDLHACRGRDQSRHSQTSTEFQKACFLSAGQPCQKLGQHQGGLPDFHPKGKGANILERIFAIKDLFQIAHAQDVKAVLAHSQGFKMHLITRLDLFVNGPCFNG